MATGTTIADINREIQQILEAYDGEDVRGSLVSALRSLNENTNGICTQAVTDAQTAADSASGSASTASTAKTQAASSASAAAASAESAATDAARAESAADAAVSGGVRSFGPDDNRRTGIVAPASGDYSSDMIVHNSGTVYSELLSQSDRISGLLATQTIQGSSMTIGANSSSDIVLTGTKQGRWTAIGIVGFSNQKNGIYQWKCIIPAGSNGGSTAATEDENSTVNVQLGLRNVTSASITLQPGVRVLWMKV